MKSGSAAVALALGLSVLAWAAPKREAGAPPAAYKGLRSAETVQSLVVGALRRAQADQAEDTCLVAASVNMGIAYTDAPAINPKNTRDETFFYDQFGFWFRSPKRQGFQVVSRCESAGTLGALGPNCQAPLGDWHSKDIVGDDLPYRRCLDEMSFDSDKAIAVAQSLGLSNNALLTVLSSKQRRHKALNDRAVWILLDDTEPGELKPGRCAVLDAASGKKLFDGSCDGLPHRAFP